MDTDPRLLSDRELVKLLRDLPLTDLGEHDPKDDALVAEAARRNLDF